MPSTSSLSPPAIFVQAAFDLDSQLEGTDKISPTYAYLRRTDDVQTFQTCHVATLSVDLRLRFILLLSLLSSRVTTLRPSPDAYLRRTDDVQTFQTCHVATLSAFFCSLSFRLV